MGITAQAVHGLRVCVIPNPDNDFRPLALRRRMLTWVAALLIIAKVAAISLVALTPATAELATITAATITELSNTERKKAGVTALKTSALLSNAAAQKAQHMLDEDYFAHISPSGVTPWFWIGKAGYEYQIAGENLAIDFTEAEDVVAAWLASPTHRDNMLNSSYTETGVAIATGEFQGGTSTVVVHMFGKPLATPGVLPAATTPAPTSLPTPTPVPAVPTPAPDTTPPRTPRIAVIDDALVVKEKVSVSIEGEAGSTVVLLLNNQIRERILLPASGTATTQLAVGTLPEGSFVVRAYATDAAGNESDMTQALAVTKDTQGPRLAQHDLAFLLSPAISSGQAALRLPGNDAEIDGKTEGWILAGRVEAPLTIRLADSTGNVTELADIQLGPSFLPAESGERAHVPARANQVVRRMAGAVAVTLIVLLLLAILIRIRIQRPALIAHASVVMFLAVLLFLF